MTKQHKATPEQWALIEETGAGRWAGAGSSCILELRARVEFLEATQHAHVDTSRLSDGEPIVLPSSPAGTLVERVQAACDDKPLGHEARAAILEVAAWLRELAPEPGPIGKMLGQVSTPFEVMADVLEQEANR
jgi:hypothetical protein